MGQDSEAAAELVATIRGEHVAMKTWFMGSSPAALELRKKYGVYPGLWKEVLNWPGWKEARKVYLQQQQTGSQQQPGEQVPRKRRSRWGSADDTNGNEQQDGGGPSKRRSRWGTDAPTAPAPPPPKPVIAPLLPGIPQGLTAQQQEQVRQLQSRLRQINDKLANVEQEAARVDALPRGHRERSPSPPPSKYSIHS
jgi:hypothetical protein